MNKNGATTMHTTIAAKDVKPGMVLANGWTAVRVAHKPAAHNRFAQTTITWRPAGVAVTGNKNDDVHSTWTYLDEDKLDVS